MQNPYINKISQELNIKAWQIEATATLLSEDATVPFIARYRKERTGSLDEVAIRAVRDRLKQLEELDKRREAILKSLEERDLLTDELKEAIDKAETMAVLEDLYLPYKPKRRTRATIAREKGLEPLALMLFEQNPELDPAKEAEAFLSEEFEIKTADDALAGARDIIAEMVNEDADARAELREYFFRNSKFESKIIEGKEESGSKYRDYFDWNELAAKAASHRVLAMLRGENEGYLRVKVRPEAEPAITLLKKRFVKNDSQAAMEVDSAVEDSYKRLLAVSLETELRNSTKESADKEAIKVFAENLRELFMAPPLGGKPVMAIDPGYRTGCKVVCLDPQGKPLTDVTLFLIQSQEKIEEAKKNVLDMIATFGIEVIAIGNGTASRETETFVRNLGLPKEISVVIVNESGASIYSASDVAREEFPNKDVTVRGAISIGRRLMDPLAELVKIDPKSIGVGQYQHDVDQTKLREALDDDVVSCVNAVGVEVNTASKQLLTYVSGLGPALARSIVEYRNENGPLKARKELLKVKRLGPKAFEQAAGFLRIREGENPLDRSAVHPESYPIVEKMASDLECSVTELMEKDELRKKIKLEDYITEKVGMPTLVDILDELAKPGRDPRGEFEPFHFAEGISTINDLEVGMKVPGVVTNVTKFGAFVDIGVHQDGLIHVSELAEGFVGQPSDVVKVQQKVDVIVIEVDTARSRISLSMRKDPFAPVQKPARKKKGRRKDGNFKAKSKPQNNAKKKNENKIITPEDLKPINGIRIGKLKKKK